MDRHRCSLLATFTLWSTCVGCTSEKAGTPEHAYRTFMIAELSGDETAIRPLIIDHADAHVLWQRPYPADVAAAFTEQYETMDISRVGSDANRVVLQSSAVPMSLSVVNTNGEWKVDAGPIIEIRKAVENSRLRSP